MKKRKLLPQSGQRMVCHSPVSNSSRSSTCALPQWQHLIRSESALSAFITSCYARGVGLARRLPVPRRADLETGKIHALVRAFPSDRSRAKPARPCGGPGARRRPRTATRPKQPSVPHVRAVVIPQEATCVLQRGLELARQDLRSEIQRMAYVGRHHGQRSQKLVQPTLATEVHVRHELLHRLLWQVVRFIGREEGSA